MRIFYLYFIIIALGITSCKQRFTPQPKGYLRIDLPPKKDTLFSLEYCPFYFTTSDYFSVEQKNNCWLDLKYKKHNTTIHLTYKKVDNNLIELLEESRDMVYKHTIKADAINEKTYLNHLHKTYGTMYDIKGPVASSVQFHITDSLKNFIRGALYFETNPNPDSLQPVIDYIRYDIIRIIETLQWKNLTSSSESKSAV